MRRSLVGGLVLALALLPRAPAYADDAGDAAAITAAVPACESARAHCFALMVHVARTDAADAAPVVTPAWIAEQVAVANAQFAAIDVGFQLAGVDFLPATAQRVRTRGERDGLGTAVRGTVIHVFLTGQLDDVDKADAIAYGVTWRTRKARKFIIVSGQARTRTLAHELGHFFGLPHSTYAISIMNKAAREVPPPEERRFADEELAIMRPVVKRLVKDGVIAEVPRPKG